MTTPVMRDTRLLREVLMDHLSTEIAKPTRDLLEALQADYGSVGRRRYERALRWLMDAGCVRREKTSSLFYDVPVYRATGAPIPKKSASNEPQRCPYCGLGRTTARTHPEHSRARRFRRSLRRRKRSGAVRARARSGT